MFYVRTKAEGLDGCSIARVIDVVAGNQPSVIDIFLSNSGSRVEKDYAFDKFRIGGRLQLLILLLSAPPERNAKFENDSLRWR